MRPLLLKAPRFWPIFLNFFKKIFLAAEKPLVIVPHRLQDDFQPIPHGSSGDLQLLRNLSSCHIALCVEIEDFVSVPDHLMSKAVNADGQQLVDHIFFKIKGFQAVADDLRSKIIGIRRCVNLKLPAFLGPRALAAIAFAEVIIRLVAGMLAMRSVALRVNRAVPGLKLFLSDRNLLMVNDEIPLAFDLLRFLFHEESPPFGSSPNGGLSIKCCQRKSTTAV